MKREIKAALSANNLNTDGPRRRLLRNLLPLKSGVEAESQRVGVGPFCRIIVLVFLLMVFGLMLSLGTFPFGQHLVGVWSFDGSSTGSSCYQAPTSRRCLMTEK